MKSRKFRKLISDAVAVIMLFVFLGAVAALDSFSWVPVIIAVVSFAYLMIAAKRRGMFYDLSR